jgi:hypothetical protein
VPHPFRFFLRKGWDANNFLVYTISENARAARCALCGPGDLHDSHSGELRNKIRFSRISSKERKKRLGFKGFGKARSNQVSRRFCIRARTHSRRKIAENECALSARSECRLKKLGCSASAKLLRPTAEKKRRIEDEHFGPRRLVPDCGVANGSHYYPSGPAY